MQARPDILGHVRAAGRPAGQSPGLLAARDRQALFLRLLRRQLGRILRLVNLEHHGAALSLEAYAVGARSPSPQPGQASVRYEALLSYSRHEPRLELIKWNLERALRLGAFEAAGRPLPVDGFRLRDLRQWANHPAGSPEDNIGSISSYCNCDCEFCYEKGTRGASIALGRAQLSLQEVNTRLRYYSPERQTGLIPSSRLSLEPFANPRCLEILERIHAAAPEEWLNLTTNGSHLTEEVVARLARLRPVMVSISLNAASVETRLCKMRDRPAAAAEVALASPALLQQYHIPFVGSYVPWPSHPLSDMEQMVRLLDRCDAVAARICLPSWTRYSHQAPPFDTSKYWAEVLAAADRLRQEVSIPIRPTPGMYALRTIRPVVQGTTKHSPAAEAGFRYGDLILALDGEPVHTRPELLRWLAARFQDARIARSRFTVQRGEECLEIEVPHPADSASLRYPYSELARPCGQGAGGRAGPSVAWAAALGLQLADGPELTSFVRLKEIVEEYPGRRVLLLISELMQSCFYEGLGLLGDLAAFVDRVELYVRKAPPEYWGGNIIVGDLWMVRDLVQATRSWIESNGVRPHVVIAPSSFLSAGGRDLAGECYLEFERELGIELRLLPCFRIVI